MRLALALAIMWTLQGCDEPVRPVQNGIEVPSGINIEELISETRGLTDNCVAALRAGGLAAMPKEVDQCFEMTKPQRWRGLWRAEFEGSEFCPEPAQVCPHSPHGKGIWLDGFSDVRRDSAIYRVEFIGRRTLYPGSHGHMGGNEHYMIVDRTASIGAVKDVNAKKQ